MENREILFRGKRRDSGEWVEGGYAEINIPLCFEPSKKEICIVARKEHTFADWGMPERMAMYEVDPPTVGQYTGLKDKNGVKVFEGDIIKYDSDEHKVYGVVSFSLVPERVGYYVNWQINENNKWARWWGENLVMWLRNQRCEVCGNLWDNPELWKSGAQD